jgi:hypothetical protein
MDESLASWKEEEESQGGSLEHHGKCGGTQSIPGCPAHREASAIDSLQVGNKFMTSTARYPSEGPLGLLGGCSNGDHQQLTR